MEAEQMVDLLRRVRHDFANHLQVIGGYLEMGNSDRVKEYLGAVIEDIRSERIIFETPDGEASLYFYEQLLKAYDIGIILRYEDIGIDSWEILKASGEPYRSLVGLKKETSESEEDEVIYLSIQEDKQGFNLLFSCSAWDCGPKVVRVNKG